MYGETLNNYQGPWPPTYYGYTQTTCGVFPSYANNYAPSVSLPAPSLFAPRQRRYPTDLVDAKAYRLAEVCCPPPVPLALCTEEPRPRPPKEAPRAITLLARLRGGRERRAVRSRLVERKDAVMR